MGFRLLITAAILAAFGLGGCGFTPLYATRGVSRGLSGVQVVVPDGRVAFRLREALDDDLGNEKGAPPSWRLDITLEQSRSPRGLRVDNVAERYQLGLTVKYTLTDLATGKVEHTGQVATDVSYDASDAPYAGIAARQDSQDRAAQDAARRIQIDLAAWMARPRGG